MGCRQEAVVIGSGRYAVYTCLTSAPEKEKLILYICMVFDNIHG